eukprot:16539-Heterococcus_DN1.PRE.3
MIDRLAAVAIDELQPIALWRWKSSTVDGRVSVLDSTYVAFEMSAEPAIAKPKVKKRLQANFSREDRSKMVCGRLRKLLEPQAKLVGRVSCTGSAACAASDYNAPLNLELAQPYSRCHQAILDERRLQAGLQPGASKWPTRTCISSATEECSKL